VEGIVIIILIIIAAIAASGWYLAYQGKRGLEKLVDRETLILVRLLTRREKGCDGVFDFESQEQDVSAGQR
jgi:type II secretory pathway pseudopilin PulG